MLSIRLHTTWKGLTVARKQVKVRRNNKNQIRCCAASITGGQLVSVFYGLVMHSKVVSVERAAVLIHQRPVVYFPNADKEKFEKLFVNKQLERGS